MSANQELATRPSIKRRFASMVYESMLLFAVVFVSGWLFSTLLEQRHALQLRHALQVWLFLVLGLYFVWFWTHGGQTLAMKTWHLRLVGEDGKPIRVLRGIGRYLLAWLWVLPGLAWAMLADAKGWGLVLGPGLNILLWGATAFLDTERRFLHDRLARTRVIRVAMPKPLQARKSA